jgi:iron-sulfur cluster assembly accessory protein
MSEALNTTLEITDSAANRIKHLLEGEADANAFRIRVDGGGCSGFQYVFDLGKIGGDDLVFEKNGIKVATDPTSIELIGGSKLDYINELGGAFFKVVNPQATSSCGCGSSFAV